MIPRGCDQQGRHPEAAEAATEVGIPDEPPEQDMLRVVIDDALLTIIVLMLVALLAGMVVGAIYG
jgi:hypothetical protein